MRHALAFIALIFATTNAIAQVRLPFDVPLPIWEELVTPTMKGQLFKSNDFRSDLLRCIEGPEYDTYEWHPQTTKELNDGETTMVLFPGQILPVKSQGISMAELEFSTYASGIFEGFSQTYSLQSVKNSPITYKDLQECSYVACISGNDGNIYVLLDRGTEEHFGWANTYLIGRLKNGYVVFPYACTVDRNPESDHHGIQNGKLGDCDLSKFTMKDAEYILRHSKTMENNIYAVMYAVITEDGRKVNWFESRLLGNVNITSPQSDEN